MKKTLALLLSVMLCLSCLAPALAVNEDVEGELVIYTSMYPFMIEKLDQVMAEQFPNLDVLTYYAVRAAKDALDLQKGDTIVMTGGDTTGSSGNTNILRIEMIP